MFSSRWRHMLLQKRTNIESTRNTGIILGHNRKRIFNAGIFLLGGSIAGTMYYFAFNPAGLYYKHSDKIEYFEKTNAMSQTTPSTYELWVPTETEVKIGKEFQLDEKAIRSHLSAIGFDEIDVSLILHEKKMKNEKLKISEILDELIEKYEKNGKKIVKDGGNKIIKIKNHKTMAIEETSDGGPDDRLSTTYNLRSKYEKSSYITGKQERGVKVITQLEVESKIVDKQQRDDVAHNIHTTLFALYAASACVFAFRRRCRLHSDIFMTPVFIFFHYFFFCFCFQKFFLP